MTISKSIIEQFKRNGARMTKARTAIIDMFQRRHLPLTESDVRGGLAKRGLRVNKTTVYRELEYLLSQKFITSVNFGDGKKRFEQAGNHHHHLICTKCRKVDEIYTNDELGTMEHKIERHKDFQITSHSLEFFGLCRNCKGN